MTPLAGITVVDLTQTFGGTFCTMHLADFGADVIKVEFQENGESAPGPLPLVNNRSATLAAHSRGKRSLTLDPVSPRGREILGRLFREADVVVLDLDQDASRRYQLNYEQLAEINQALVYASITGYGSFGPLSAYRCHDTTAQAVSGTMSMTGFPDQDPTATGVPIGDTMGGAKLCLGILMALWSRMDSGHGQKLEVAMADALFEINESPILFQAVLGQETIRAGNGDATITPYEIYETEDGHISIGVASDAVWPNFCRAIQMGHLLEDRRFATNEMRLEHYHSLNEEITAYVKIMKKQELQDRLEENGVPAAPVLSVAEAMRHPQLLHREMVVELEAPAIGNLTLPGAAIKLDRSPAKISRRIPEAGEHTEEILVSLGYSKAEIEDMRREHII